MQQNTPHIPDDLPKTKTFSPDLQQAINQIYLWVKDGFPEHDYFDYSVGICSNVSLISEYDSYEVNELLFGEDEYPFNSESSDIKYFEEVNKYTNPKRLAWLQEHQTVE